MKVSFRQVGGSCGHTRGCELDSAELSQAEAALIESLVNQCNLPRSLTMHSARAVNATHFDLVVNDRGATYILSVDDGTMSSNQSQLIEYLASRAESLPVS
jgi:hypothetical protein